MLFIQSTLAVAKKKKKEAKTETKRREIKQKIAGLFSWLSTPKKKKKSFLYFLTSTSINSTCHCFQAHKQKQGKRK